MKTKTVITICLGSSCYRRGNQTILEIIKDYLAKYKLTEEVDFKGHLCTGKCTEGPNIKINETDYSAIDTNSIIEILNKHLTPEKNTIK